MESDFQKSWKAFKASNQGTRCLDEGILRRSDDARFLENRIFEAFNAGFVAGEQPIFDAVKMRSQSETGAEDE